MLYLLLIHFQDDIMILPMTNKHGQKYQCQLPKPKEVNEGEKTFDPSKVRKSLKGNCSVFVLSILPKIEQQKILNFCPSL